VSVVAAVCCEAASSGHLEVQVLQKDSGRRCLHIEVRFPYLYAQSVALVLVEAQLFPTAMYNLLPLYLVKPNLCSCLVEGHALEVLLALLQQHTVCLCSTGGSVTIRSTIRRLREATEI
jgi:hypothetical protein